MKTNVASKEHFRGDDNYSIIGAAYRVMVGRNCHSKGLSPKKLGPAVGIPTAVAID